MLTNDFVIHLFSVFIFFFSYKLLATSKMYCCLHYTTDRDELNPIRNRVASNVLDVTTATKMEIGKCAKISPFYRLENEQLRLMLVALHCGYQAFII